MTDPHDLFLTLSDPLRLRAIALLAAEGELCVCQLTAALDEVQPKVSRHLGLLRDAGVVAPRRSGRWMHYRLSPELAGWRLTAVEAAAKAAAEIPDHAADRVRLADFGKPMAGAFDV